MDGDVHLWQVQFPVTAETSIPVQCNRALPPQELSHVTKNLSEKPGTYFRFCRIVPGDKKFLLLLLSDSSGLR